MNEQILGNMKTAEKWIPYEEYVKKLRIRKEKIDLPEKGQFFSNDEYFEIDVGGAIGIRYYFQSCDIGYDLYKEDIGESAVREIIIRQILPLHFCNLKFMVLHANMVLDLQGGKAFMISGKSSAGKSTFTYHLLNRNYLLFCDDMVVLNEENNPVWYNPNLKLTCESCRYFNIRYSGNTDKEIVRCEDERAITDTIICNSIFILNPKEEIETVWIEEVVGGSKLAAVYANLYGNDFLPAYLKKREIGIVLKKLDTIRVYNIYYTKSFSNMDKIIEKIEDILYG